jgi:hypothetical protein
VVVSLEENGDGQIHGTVIKEKEAELSHKDKRKINESYGPQKSMGETDKENNNEEILTHE